MPHQNNFLHFPIKKTKILFFLNEYLHLYLISFQISLFIMFTGTVKFYNEAKGFGFIIDDETYATYLLLGDSPEKSGLIPHSNL